MTPTTSFITTEDGDYVSDDLKYGSRDMTPGVAMVLIMGLMAIGASIYMYVRYNRHRRAIAAGYRTPSKQTATTSFDNPMFAIDDDDDDIIV